MHFIIDILPCVDDILSPESYFFNLAAFYGHVIFQGILTDQIAGMQSSI